MDYKKFEDNLPTNMITEEVSINPDMQDQGLDKNDENEIIHSKSKPSMDIYFSDDIPEHHDVGETISKKFYQKPTDHPTIWPVNSIKVECDDCREKMDTKVVKG